MIRLPCWLARTARAQRTLSIALNVEELEDRWVPDTYRWAPTPGGNNWDSQWNWQKPIDRPVIGIN